jgi:hypothetical protein
MELRSPSRPAALRELGFSTTATADRRHENATMRRFKAVVCLSTR